MLTIAPSPFPLAQNSQQNKAQLKACLACMSLMKKRNLVQVFPIAYTKGHQGSLSTNSVYYAPFIYQSECNQQGNSTLGWLLGLLHPGRLARINMVECELGLSESLQRGSAKYTNKCIVRDCVRRRQFTPFNFPCPLFNSFFQSQLTSSHSTF